MPIFSGRINRGEQSLLEDMFSPNQTGIRGDERPQVIPDGRGGYILGTSFDLALLKAKDPEGFSTPSLSAGMVGAKASNDSAINGMFATNVAGLGNTQIRLSSARQGSAWFTSLFPDVPADLVNAQFDEIYSEENSKRESSDLYRLGPLGVGPGTTVNEAGKAGEDKSFYEGRGNILHHARLLADRRNPRFMEAERNPQRNDWKPELIQAIEDIAPGSFRGMKVADITQNEEMMDEAIDLARQTSTVNKADLDRLDLDAFPAIKAAADERGLDQYARRVFVYEQAQQHVNKAVHTMINNPNEINGLAVLEQVKALSQVVGPDFLSESLAVANQSGNWGSSAWDQLPGGVRAGLEFAGYREETFLRDDDGEIRGDIQNSFKYAAEANRIVSELAATNAREMSFDHGWHDGWANWTRRLTDTFKVDVGNDPFAMYFLVPSVVGGVGAGAIFGAGSATAATTSVGRIMAMTAVDGLTAGLAEGYAASVAGQTQSVVGGIQEQLDWNGVTTNMLLYGGMGAIGGAGLAGAIHGIGPGLRGLGRLGTHITSLADDIAATGVVGENAMSRALNRLVEREATVAEVEGAQIFANIENRGLAIRLNRGEVEAKEAIAEVIPGMVHVKGGNHSALVDNLFSSSSLAENGLSPAAAVDLVYGIQRRLGAGQQIAAEEFDQIVRAAFHAAKEHAAKFGGDLYDETGKLVRGVTDARIQQIDAAVTANMKAIEERFVGGSGIRSLSDTEHREFKALVQKLKDSTLSEKQVRRLMDMTQSVHDEKIMKAVQKIINDRGNVPAEELGVFNRRLDEIVTTGTKARNEDSFLKTVLRVENALNLLRNESTIKAAQELGISAKRLLQYASKYKSIVGDEVAIRALDAEMSDARAAFQTIAKGEGMRVLDGTPPAFNVNRFLETSDAVEAVRELRDLRTKMTRMTKRAAKLAERRGDEAVIRRLQKVADRTAKRFQELNKKLGIDFDVEDASKRVLDRLNKDIPYSARTSMEKDAILGDAIEKLIFRSSPDAVSVGEAGRTKAWFATLFEGTSVGEKMERLMASASLWPIAQNKLFRSRNRIVRGMSNWITGQHVSNRVFSNSTDFMSIESIVEGAAREAVPFMNLSKGLQRKLGSSNYGAFDTFFLKLRQMGKLAGKPNEFDLGSIPEVLVRVYDQLGGEEALRADLYAAQRTYTNMMTMAIEEAAEAGAPLTGVSATRYIPHHIRGGLTAERATKFVDSFVKIRRNQLLTGKAALDAEVLHSIGWIRLTKGSEKDAMGRTLVNKKFDIPQDSPFHISDDLDINREYAQTVMKRGFAALTELEPESAAPTPGRAAAVSSDVNHAIDVIEDPATRAEISRVFDEVPEILGNSMHLPLGRSVETAGADSAAARGILGLDETVSRLENARSTLARVSDEVAEEIEAETGINIQMLRDEIDNALGLRQRALSRAADARAGDTAPRVRRKSMNANQKIKYVNDREAFAGLSEGHAALSHRLDSLIAEGFLDEDAAKLIRLAFVDMDPHKVAGMSFTRMDPQDVARRYLGIAEEDGIIRLRRLAEHAGADADRSLNAAITLAHETAHIAFLSSSARMQGVLQSLFNQAKAGHNNIRRLFDQLGVDTEYALSNVHEFTAALCEVTMLRNQVAVARRGTLGTFLAKFGKFYKKLFGEVAVLSDESASMAEQIMGKENWSAIKQITKAMYEAQPEDTATDRIMRLFGVDVADTIDEYRLVDADLGRAGQAAPDEKLAFLKRKADKAEETLNKTNANPRATAQDKQRAQNSFNKAAEELVGYMEKSMSKAAPKTRLQSIMDKVALKLELESFTPDQRSAIAEILTHLSEEDGNLIRRTPGRGLERSFEDVDEDAIIDSLIKTALDEQKAATRRGGEAFDREKRAITGAVDDQDRAMIETTASRDQGEMDLPGFTDKLDAAALSKDKDVKKAAERINEAQKLQEAFERRGLKRDKAGTYRGLTNDMVSEIAEETGLSKTAIVKHNSGSNDPYGILNSSKQKSDVDIINSFEGDAEKKAVVQLKAIREEVAPKIERAVIEDIAANSDTVQRHVSETSAGNSGELKAAPEAEVFGPPEMIGPMRKASDDIQEVLDEMPEEVAPAAKAAEPEALGPPEMVEPIPVKPVAELTDDELLATADDLIVRSRKRKIKLAPWERERLKEAKAELDRRTAPAGGEGEPPSKPPKTKKGPDEEPGEPRKPTKVEKATEDYLNRRRISKVERGKFNTNHRLATSGKSLAQLYSDAVNGDTSILHAAYVKELKEMGSGKVSALEKVGRDYVDHAGGRFKTSFTNGAESLDERINVLGDIGSFHTRTFNDSDFDGEFGDQLADLFAEATSSAEGLMRYADTTLSSIRVQKGINQLTGEKGVSMKEMFEQMEKALQKNLMRDDRGSVRSLTKRDADQVKEWMQQTKEIYLRARGFNPAKDKSFSQTSRIVQNMAYSMLGAKFAMSVLFVETPMAVLRTSGLNPFKMIHNTGTILGAYLNAAKGFGAQFPPLQKFMASMGMDTRIINESVEDMVFSFSNLRSTSLSRFGAGGEGLEDSKLLFTLKDRISAHLENIRGAGSADSADPNFLKSLINYTEAASGAAADMTGTMSFMHPVTNAVREIGANQAKATLFKHSGALVQLAKRVGAAGEITTDGIVGIARELGIPKGLAVYAAESGLLRRDGALIERLMKLAELTPESPGRSLDMNNLRFLIDSERTNLTETAMGGLLETAGSRQADIDADILPSLNQFIMYFTNELSPELRGTMRFQGMNPLTDLLFQMLSYPMAAYQALVGNGVTARGPLMVAGVLTTLTAMEYFNRNAQRVLFGKDEELRQQSLEKLTRIPTEEDIVEVLSMYGTSSPLFGAVGTYVKDLVGNPIMRAYGASERAFPATPFRSPAIGMLQKAYGQVSRGLGSVGTAYRTGDPAKMETAAGNIAGTLYDLSPLNALPLGQAGTAIKNVTNVGDLWKAAHVGMTAGTRAATPEFVYPPLEAAPYMRWFDADESPRSLQDVKMPEIPSIPTDTSSIPRAAGRQTPQPAAQPSQDRGPSSGLADLL